MALRSDPDKANNEPGSFRLSRQGATSRDFHGQRAVLSVVSGNRQTGSGEIREPHQNPLYWTRVQIKRAESLASPHASMTRGTLAHHPKQRTQVTDK